MQTDALINPTSISTKTFILHTDFHSLQHGLFSSFHLLFKQGFLSTF